MREVMRGEFLGDCCWGGMDGRYHRYSHIPHSQTQVSTSLAVLPLTPPTSLAIYGSTHSKKSCATRPPARNVMRQVMREVMRGPFGEADLVAVGAGPRRGVRDHRPPGRLLPRHTEKVRRDAASLTKCHARGHARAISGSRSCRCWRGPQARRAGPPTPSPYYCPDTLKKSCATPPPARNVMREVMRGPFWEADLVAVGAGLRRGGWDH
jgi:hypothetical protein